MKNKSYQVRVCEETSQTEVKFNSKFQGKFSMVTKFKSAVSVLLVLLVVLMTSCQNSQVPVTPSVDDALIEIDNNLETIAKVVAQAINNPDVLSAISEAAAERFDGDTEVLFKDLSVETQEQMAVALSTLSAQEGQKLTTAAASNELQVLSTFTPRLQIAVYGDPEDISSDTLVTYAPVGVNEKDVKEIKAFDAEGKVHILDGQIAPSEPVIVVGINERTNNEGILLPQFQADSAKPEASNLETQACYKNVLVDRVYLRDDKEPWFKGDPEIRLIAKSTDEYLLYHGSFTNVNDEKKWYYPGRFLGCTSTDVVFYWYEDDGTKLEFTPKYKDFSLTIKIDDDDDFIGEVKIPYYYIYYNSISWDLGDIVFHVGYPPPVIVN